VTIHTPDWVRDAVFYEIFPDRFARSRTVPMPGTLEPWDVPPTYAGFKGGDLAGIAEHLDDLADLGITALYLTPVFASAANHRYHAYDYMTVDPLLGGDAALRDLLDRAHERGMKVILDGVFNHCGRGFWPFHHVLENGAASPYRNWFLLDPAVLSGERQLDAYPGRGHATGVGSDQLGYRAWWGLPALPKFNIDEPAVREYLLRVAEHWLRFGIDGWRLDVPAEIDDERFWQEFRRRCRAIDPEAYLVGEIWDEAPAWLLGDRFDALMNYPLGTAILGFAGGAHLDAAVIGRHDTYRRMLQPLDGPAFAVRLQHLMTDYDPAVVAVQLNLVGSHDTPRALTVLSGDRLAFRLTMLLQATLPGAPCIYYGDEIGMEGDGDPDCRRAYPAGREDGDRWLRTFVQAILAARHAHVALRRGTVRALAAEGAAIAYLREAEGRTALVALNAGGHAVSLRVPAGPADRSLALPGLAIGTVAAAGEATAGPAAAGEAMAGLTGIGAASTWTLRLPPQGALVLVEP
jgi:neopullulanase